MSVLVEGTSVICRVDSIHKKFKGGWGAFEGMVPNQTLASDNEVVRVGFMTPPDVDAFLARLTQGGLEWLRDGECVDIATADQRAGILNKCAWLEFGHGCIDGNTEHRVAVCRLAGSKATNIYFPTGWQCERSLSRNGRFISNEELQTRARHLRREGSLDVHLDLKSGKEMYVGRTEGEVRGLVQPAAVAQGKPSQKLNWRAKLFYVLVLGIPSGLLVTVVARDIHAESLKHPAPPPPTACEQAAMRRFIQDAANNAAETTKESLGELTEELHAQSRGDASAAIAHHNRRLELDALAEREEHSLDDAQLLGMTLQRECPSGK